MINGLFRKWKLLKQPLPKLLEIGLLKSLKKTYEGIGILHGGVLEMLHKNLVNLKVASHHVLLSSEIIIFEEMLSVAASELYCLIRNLHYQISGFMNETFLKVIQA